MAGERFDLVVVGGGPGGYTGAIRAAQLGMRVAVVEKAPALGGTCLRIGCIPSKALLDSSEAYAQARKSLAAQGVKVAGVELDLPTMMGRKDKIVGGLTQGIAGLFKKNKIAWIVGAGRLASKGSVEVRGDKGTETVQAGRIMIATGSEVMPLKTLPLDGKRIVGSTEALSLPAVPRRLLVVGAGAVGLELGSVWGRLGAEVTVVELLDRIVPGTDRQMGRLLERALSKQGFTFRLETSAVAATPAGDAIRVTLESKGERSEVDADVVLVAIGRRPHTEGLGARELGVAFDERGRIKVNERYETSVAGVFAIGDVIPGPMLAHKAEEEGVACVELMNGKAGHVAYECIPSVVYTWPELASVGLSEEDAAAKGEIATGVFPFMANARAKCLGDTDGSVKVVADKRTDRVLGVHVVGPRASDLIAEAVLAMELGASAEDIARTVHAHPTLPEALKEAALGVAKRQINI